MSEHLLSREPKNHFPAHEIGEREPCLMRLVPDGGDPPLIVGRMMTGYFLLHVGPLKGLRNAVLRDPMIWRGFLGEVVENVLRQPRRWITSIRRHSAVGTDAAHTQFATGTRRRAAATGNPEGRSKHRPQRVKPSGVPQEDQRGGQSHELCPGYVHRSES